MSVLEASRLLITGIVVDALYELTVSGKRARLIAPSKLTDNHSEYRDEHVTPIGQLTYLLLHVEDTDERPSGGYGGGWKVCTL